MFGKRCSLCGGKLNSSGICTECGLDNSKSDKNYRINRSDCDGMPLTHVHEEKEKYRPDRKADHREINHKETNHKKRDYGKQGYRMNESDMTGKKRRKHVQTPDITNRRRPLKIVILAIIVIAVLEIIMLIVCFNVAGNAIILEINYLKHHDEIIRGGHYGRY